MPDIEYKENKPRSRREVNIQNFINTNKVERLMTLLFGACKFIESKYFEVHIKIPTHNHKCHTHTIINYFINFCMWLFVSVLPVSLQRTDILPTVATAPCLYIALNDVSVAGLQAICLLNWL
jgi:hypothetical protein